MPVRTRWAVLWTDCIDATQLMMCPCWGRCANSARSAITSAVLCGTISRQHQYSRSQLQFDQYKWAQFNQEAIGTQSALEENDQLNENRCGRTNIPNNYFQDAEKTKNRIEAENKTLQDKLDREAKALKDKMSEENEKRMNEAKALQVRSFTIRSLVDELEFLDRLSTRFANNCHYSLKQ